MQTVGVFYALYSCWRTAGSGRLLGLDYGEVRSYFELAEIEPEARREIFEGLCVMERAVIEEAARQNSKQG